MILLWAAEGEERHRKFGESGKKKPLLTPRVLLGRLRLTLLMKTLIALAHRSAGFALGENVLNLGFATCEIAICWYP